MTTVSLIQGGSWDCPNGCWFMSLCHLPSQMEPQVPWCQRLPLRFLTGPVRTQVVLSPEKREGAGEVVIQQRGQTGRTESILGLCGAIISLDLDARILWSQPESRAGGLGPWLVPTSRGYPRSCTDNRCQGEGGCVSVAEPSHQLPWSSRLMQLASCVS